MPCYLFTFHGHYTWMPDNQRGYVHRLHGLQQRDPHMAQHYRRFRDVDVVRFTDVMQSAMVETTIQAGPFINATVHACASASTHVHILVSWKSQRDWKSIRTSFRTALSRMLNAKFNKRDWFTDGSSRKRVRDLEHFDYLILKYLPDHPNCTVRDEDQRAAEQRDALRPLSMRQRGRQRPKRRKNEP